MAYTKSRTTRRYPPKPLPALAEDALAGLADRDLRARMLALQRMPWTLPYGETSAFTDRIVGKKSAIWKPAYLATKAEIARRQEALAREEA